MQPDVQRDFDFGRRFLPTLKMICGNHLIGEAPFEEDAQRATDLIVLRLEAVRIACRVRRAERYLDLYGHEFTIRSARDNGRETELAKILAGFGDYFLYGFGAEDGTLAAWVLGDLTVFRRWFVRGLAKGTVPGTEIANSDGTRFRAFSLAVMPRDFIRAQLGLSVEQGTLA